MSRHHRRCHRHPLLGHPMAECVCEQVRRFEVYLYEHRSTMRVTHRLALGLFSDARPGAQDHLLV